MLEGSVELLSLSPAHDECQWVRGSRVPSWTTIAPVLARTAGHVLCGGPGRSWNTFASIILAYFYTFIFLLSFVWKVVPTHSAANSVWNLWKGIRPPISIPEHCCTGLTGLWEHPPTWDGVHACICRPLWQCQVLEKQIWTHNGLNHCSTSPGLGCQGWGSSCSVFFVCFC